MNSVTLTWLDLPVPPRVVFARSPLSLALCQVRFAPILGVSNPAVVAPFQTALADDYPAASNPEQNLDIRVSAGGAQASLRSALGSVVWRFADLEDNWVVTLSTESVALETHAYNDFSDFLSRLGRVLKALTKHIRPMVGARVGLRYINEIPVTPDSWGSVVRPELLGPLAVPALAAKATGSVQQLALRGPDGVSVTVQHGLVPAGTVVVPRAGAAPSDEKVYVLDYDVYREYTKAEPLKMAVGGILDQVEAYHEAISLLFRWSVTENYRATLGRREQ